MHTQTEDEEDFFHCLERFSIVDKKAPLYKPEKRVNNEQKGTREEVQKVKK